MARVLVLWQCPASLSRAGTVRWLSAEAARLRVAEAIAEARVIAVAPYAPEHAACCDGMLEIRLQSDRARPEPALAQLLGDLHGLGMCPIAVVTSELD